MAEDKMPKPAAAPRSPVDPKPDKGRAPATPPGEDIADLHRKRPDDSDPIDPSPGGGKQVPGSPTPTH